MQTTLDTVISRLLLVRPQIEESDESAPNTGEGAFSFALLFSGVRCIIMYVILPFVLPVLGIAGHFGVAIDIVINVIAIAAIVYSLRRFWTINYKRKWQYLPVAVVAFVLLIAFIALDISTLL
ncbi:MAG: hypothetical protein Q9P44_12385 [Anaerolineae bacterium]|nr:hypothetical protein [Anaerolineae bacterium]